VTDDSSPFKIASTFTVAEFRDGHAIPIPDWEWDELINKVEGMRDPPWVWQVAGGLLWGVALSVTVGLFTSGFAISQRSAAIAAAAASAFCGVVAFCEAGRVSKHRRGRASEICERMKAINARFKRADTATE